MLPLLRLLLLLLLVPRQILLLLLIILGAAERGSARTHTGRAGRMSFVGGPKLVFRKKDATIIVR